MAGRALPARRRPAGQSEGDVPVSPTRPSTPPEPLPGGGHRITVKRSCSGCGAELGDATDAELEAAVAGMPLPDTTAEHGCNLTTTPPLTDPHQHQDDRSEREALLSQAAHERRLYWIRRSRRCDVRAFGGAHRITARWRPSAVAPVTARLTTVGASGACGPRHSAPQQLCNQRDQPATHGTPPATNPSCPPRHLRVVFALKSFLHRDGAHDRRSRTKPADFLTEAVHFTHQNRDHLHRSVTLPRHMNVGEAARLFGRHPASTARELDEPLEPVDGRRATDDDARPVPAGRVSDGVHSVLVRGHHEGRGSPAHPDGRCSDSHQEHLQGVGVGENHRPSTLGHLVDRQAPHPPRARVCSLGQPGRGAVQRTPQVQGRHARTVATSVPARRPE